MAAQRLLELHPAADIEFRAAIDWYDEQEPALGARFEAAVYQAFERIDENPSAWKPWRGSPLVRMYWLRRFPFYIPYIADGERVIVLAMAHAKRDPGYWTERLQS
jgi:toxin ParE1/3/4